MLISTIAAEADVPVARGSTASSSTCDADSDQEHNTSELSIPDHLPTAEKYSFHPSVREKLRNYQWELAVPGLSGQNYIICSPTGSGKTCVAALIISEHLKESHGSAKVLFVVNKVPLATQQFKYLQKTLCGVKVQKVIGESSVHKKAELEPAASNSFNSNDESSESDSEFKNFDSMTNDIIVCTAGCLINALNQRKTSLSTFSLMVMDECHNTKKNSNYARIMHHYIKQKLQQNKTRGNLPQVVGLTATPGAGDAACPTLNTVLTHLTSLCAAMDAHGGIKTVHKHKEELKSFHNSPGKSQCMLGGRRVDEPFITLVSEVMEMLEKTFKLNSPSVSKWMPEYICWVNQESRKYQHQDDRRDTLSTLNTLKCLCSSICTYYSLRFEDAMSVLQQHNLPNSDSATSWEKKLSRIMNQLQVKLSSLEKVRNPLLVRLEEVLVKQFKDIPQSRAIIFVETKSQASSVSAWLTSTLSLQDLKPGVITGHQRGGGKMMTTADQTSILDRFSSGDVNVLVSTSVAEEGIDVPSCNLVVNYQKVSSEIADVQSRGRARASQSHSFTIVSSESSKHYQQLMNDQKNMLVEPALELLPAGELLSRLLPSKQKDILSRVEIQESKRKESKQKYSPYGVHIQCIQCSEFLCNGSEVRILAGSSHHVVTIPNFVGDKVTIKKHHQPTVMKQDLSKTHKIYCIKCSQDLGVYGSWWKDSNNYPVLKCDKLKFIGKDNTITIKKQWKKAPFEILKLTI